MSFQDSLSAPLSTSRGARFSASLTPGLPRRQVTVSLPSNLVDALDDYLEEPGYRSAYLAYALARALDEGVDDDA